MEFLDFSGYAIEPLREGGEFDLYRGRSQGSDPAILVSTVGRRAQGSGNSARLEHEHTLARELEPAWALRPLAITHYEGRRALILEDPGGDPLDSTVGTPFELTHFLRVSAALASALGQVHFTGLVHNDIRPENVLLDSAGRVRFTGFGMASRSSERRVLPSDLPVGSLPYLAPEQTGRINRAVDARGDLYSLGMTFYEMLTGRLPFTASDPQEWIHCHIAHQPPPPSQRVDSLPAAVEAIVMKLIGKNPEDRYQTAAGLTADLSRCLHELQTRGHIDPFLLGEDDISKRLVIGSKLVGREAEVRALVSAFDRVSTHGTSETALLSGHAGIGKSAILSELRRTLAEAPCLFALGKAEQYGTSTPLATLSQALQSLVRQLLVKKEAELSDWRSALLEALGTEGQLIVNAVPELALVIGAQPPAGERPSRDAQDRFYTVLKRFLRVFARPQHTLIICLDDLQWLDQPTLEIIERLATRGPLKLIRMLLGATAEFGSFDEDAVAEEPYERYLEANRLLTHATVRYWIRKLQARFYAEEYAAALAAAAKAQPLLAATLRSFEFAEYHLYAALAQAALCSASGPDGAELNAIAAHHAQLLAWAEECPANFSCRAALVGAEIARLTGRELDAERLYEEAIQLSRQHGFIQTEGVSNELAARFYASRGFDTIANTYLLQARDCYERWGAHGKLRHLDERNPRLHSTGELRSVSAPGERVDTLDLGTMLVTVHGWC